MTGFGTNPIFGSHWAVLGMIAALVLLQVIAPRYQSLPTRRRQILVAMRVALIALLALAMLRPNIVTTLTTPQSAVLLVLFDKSRSMQQPAAVSDQSRWDAQSTILEQIEGELSSFDDDFELRLYAYDTQLHQLELQEGTLPSQTAPDGRETDIGSSLHDALQSELGRRVAGIVLLGDGAQTAVNPRFSLQESVRELARLDSPLFTVGFGPVGDTTQARDIAIESMPDRYTVFVKNQLDVKAAIRVRGYVNKELPIELIVENEKGEQERLGPHRLTARSDNELVPVSFPFVPAEPGTYKLTMRAAIQAGELLTQNNELTAFLTVLEGGLRVLYLYGELVGEQQQLRRSIDAAPDMQLDDQYIQFLNNDGRKIDLSSRLQGRAYDAVLIESVDVAAMSSGDMERLGEMVSSGTGMMMIGGYNSFGAGGYYDSPLGDALPVVMNRFERQDLDPRRPISRDLHIWGELTLTPSSRHPVTSLAEESSNSKLWSTLPGLQGANRLRPKPAARVLLEAQTGDPILVAGNFGRGRVLAFAGNTTARWWKYGRATEHRRFWRQVILWLTHREDLDRNDVWLSLPQRRFPLGAPIDFSTGVQSAGGEPVLDATLTAVSKSVNGGSQPIRLTASGDDFLGAMDPPEEPGDYVIQIEATRGNETIGVTSARLQVIEQDLELSDPAANYEQLARLARATRDAGGKPVAPEELKALLGELRRSYRDAEVEVQSKWQLGDTSLDAWLLFICILSLATGEWVFRKKWGLV